MYRNLPIKRPWALEIHGPKTWVCAYTEMGAYSGEYGTRMLCPHAWILSLSLSPSLSLSLSLYLFFSLSLSHTHTHTPGC